jgi:hypothetical protein
MCRLASGRSPERHFLPLEVDGVFSTLVILIMDDPAFSVIGFIHFNYPRGPMSWSFHITTFAEQE